MEGSAGLSVRPRAPGTASSIRAARARGGQVRRARASTPSTSTPSRSTRRSTACRAVDDEGLGRAHAQGLRVLAEALSEVHPPRDVRQGDGRRRSDAPRRRGRRRVPARSIRSRRRQARRAARAVPRQLQERAERARLPRMAARALQAITRSPSSCGIAAGATTRRRSSCSNDRSTPRGRRSTSRSSGRRSGRTCCPTCARSTTCGCTAGTPRNGGRTRSPRIATTICIRPRSSSRSPRAAADAARAG